MYSAAGTLASPWNLTKANSFIEANFISLRRYIQAATQFSQAFVMSTTSGGTPIYTSPGLCSTTPDEATRMIVFASVEEGSILSGTPATMHLVIADSAGTVISPSLANLCNIPVPYGKAVGMGTFIAGVNPGFQIFADCNTGSANAVVYGWAMVAPQ